MKLIIASDIHGAADWCAALLREVEREQPDKLVLLGDILYHGPRNDLPADYAPKRVIAMLNPLAERIICVRGNCEAEVDQMVLDFPCMAESCQLYAADCGQTLFLTHGHVWGPGIHNSVDRWPALAAGDALVYGHTHKKVLEVQGEGSTHAGVIAFNPGSVGIPKDGSHSFGVYDSSLPAAERFSYRLLSLDEAAGDAAAVAPGSEA